MTDFTNILGPEPVWLTCACGEITARVPCWSCGSQAEAKSKADEHRDALRATIPGRYSWARLTAPELRVRAKVPVSIEDASARVLGAARAIFSGPSGSGKTSFGVACLRRRIECDAKGIFVSALRLGTARIQSAAGQGEASLVERAMTAPLVLLDEVGGEAKTATNAVRDVVFARYDSDLPTWITTGFSSQQLAEMYGDGFLRRVLEDAYVVRCGGAK